MKRWALSDCKWQFLVNYLDNNKKEVVILFKHYSLLKQKWLIVSSAACVVLYEITLAFSHRIKLHLSSILLAHVGVPTQC